MAGPLELWQMVPGLHSPETLRLSSGAAAAEAGPHGSCLTEPGEHPSHRRGWVGSGLPGAAPRKVGNIPEQGRPGHQLAADLHA